MTTSVSSSSNPRGFSLSHQHVALELHFDGVAQGWTELTILPTDPSLRTVHVNCRQAGEHAADILFPQ